MVCKHCGAAMGVDGHLLVILDDNHRAEAAQ